jgi:HEAT repeat protein
MTLNTYVSPDPPRNDSPPQARQRTYAAGQETRRATWLWSAGALLLLAAGAPLASGEEARPPAADTIAIEDALRQLSSPDWILQARGMAALARAKESRAVAPLKAILAGQGHPWVRGRALVALAGILGDAVADNALALASHPAPELRAAALEALSLTGSPRALAAVEAHLADPAAPVRRQALLAFARLQKDKAWERIAPLAADADPAVVCGAAAALVYVGTPEARQALVGLLAHKQEDVRIAAARALRETRDPEAILPLFAHRVGDSAENVKAACEESLLAYDPAVLAKPLLAALDLPDYARRTAVLKLFKARPSPEALAGIAAYLSNTSDRDSYTIVTALEVLSATDPAPFQAVYERCLENRQAQARLKAIEALAQCPGADLWSLLKARLADRETSVREAVLRALRRAATGAPPGGVAEYLAAAVQDRQAEVAREALALFKERLDAKDLPKALVVLGPALANGDLAVRGLAVDALEPLAGDDAARQIAAAQGYLTDWRVIGPFPSDAARRGYTAVYAPEQEVDFTKSYEAPALPPEKPGERSAAKTVAEAGPPLRVSWQAVQAKQLQGQVDLREAFAGDPYRVAYAATDLESPDDRKVLLTVSADDGMKIWVNGTFLAQRPDMGSTRAEVGLKKGPNRLLVKVCNEHDNWFFSVRVSDADGRRIDALTAAPR